MSDVPCNGCTECCRGPDRILYVSPSEDYETEFYRGRFILKQRPNGDCWYLTDDGCGIYDKRPIQCRIFDCRLYVKDSAFPLRIREAGKRARLR